MSIQYLCVVVLVVVVGVVGGLHIKGETLCVSVQNVQELVAWFSPGTWRELILQQTTHIKQHHLILFDESALFKNVVVEWTNTNELS